MTGIEIITVVSGALNIIGIVAGVFGWKRYGEIKETARQVERVGEAVIQGVEACEKLIGSADAKRVKRSVQAVAEAAGVEGFLHRWLVRLGLAKE